MGRAFASPRRARQHGVACATIVGDEPIRTIIGTQFIRWSSRIAATLLAIGLLLPSIADAATTLDAVKARDTVRCGVSEGIAGFSQRDAAGHWSGIDVDFCRAVAAAVLGDAGKATFVPLRASERFPALRLGNIDLLLRNTTWTLGREAGLGVLFAGVLLYDGQSFMVAADSPIASLAQLTGATVCVEKGTNHGQYLADWSTARGIPVTPTVYDSAPLAAAAFFEGRCTAYTSDFDDPRRRARIGAGRAHVPHPARADFETAARARGARRQRPVVHARALGAVRADRRR